MTGTYQTTDDQEDSPSNEIDKKRKIAQQRVLLMGIILSSVIAAGSFACVAFGISEIVNKDTVLMNSGLGEVMTVIGICYILPYIFCLVAFMILKLDLSCCFSDNGFRGTRLVVIVFVMASVIVQQVISDYYLFVCLGPVAAAFIALDLGVIFCYGFWRFHDFYIPTACCVLLCLVKMSTLWNFVSKRSVNELLGPNSVRSFVFLTLPIVQLPLYIPRTPSGSEENLRSVWEGEVIYNSPSENSKSNFNLLLFHLLNSVDVISVYTSFLSNGYQMKSSSTVPEPFRIFIMIIIGIAFICNNASVIHLFYARDGAENSQLMILPAKLREATNLWSSQDAGGTHKRRIMQYMLFLLLVCDVPLLAVRIQLWLRGHQMLSVLVTKNIKSIVDVFMIVLHVDHSSGYSHHDQYLLTEND